VVSLGRGCAAPEHRAGASSGGCAPPADVHPPLYFLLLHGWMRLAGDSVLALRLPSLWMGLIALAGTFAVGARLFDRRTGLWAMVLLGAAGFLLYYTREARMFVVLHP